MTFEKNSLAGSSEAMQRSVRQVQCTMDLEIATCRDLEHLVGVRDWGSLA